MKRVSNLYEELISDENLRKAIDEVNRTHHWRTHHRPNPTTAWVEETKDERLEDLRHIIERGFCQKPPRIKERYDPSAQKTRIISEPIQWPDQYVHHALVQVLQPVFMRGMDRFCCGSIKGRGTHYGKKAIEKWMKNDKTGTRYELSGDIRHFYGSLKPEVVMRRMRDLIKDHRTMDLIEHIIKDGIMIGAYTSQWFANVVLQPLDTMIRQSGLCSHYIRYMDNLTIFGPNKRKLRKLKYFIEVWLKDHDLTLKGDWQIFPVEYVNPNERGGVKHGRTPDAVGYRYGRNADGSIYTIPRKHTLFRLKRKIHAYHRKVRSGKPIQPTTAAGLLSRLGQLDHCNNHHLYQMIYSEGNINKPLKKIVRENQRKENLTWSMYLAQRAMPRSFEQKVLIASS